MLRKLYVRLMAITRQGAKRVKMLREAFVSSPLVIDSASRPPMWDIKVEHPTGRVTSVGKTLSPFALVGLKQLRIASGRSPRHSSYAYSYAHPSVAKLNSPPPPGGCGSKKAVYS